MKPSFASCPPDFLASRESGSVVEACVSFYPFSPLKLRLPLRPRAGTSSRPSLRRKLLMLAHACIRVPSIEKCSSDSSILTYGRSNNADMKATAMSPSSRRSPLLLNAVGIQTGRPPTARRASGTAG